MRKAATIAIEPNAASGSFSATPISHPVMEDFDVRKRNIRLRNVRIYVTVQLYAVIDLVSTKLKRVMG